MIKGIPENSSSSDSSDSSPERKILPLTVLERQKFGKFEGLDSPDREIMSLTLKQKKDDRFEEHHSPDKEIMLHMLKQEINNEFEEHNSSDEIVPMMPKQKSDDEFEELYLPENYDDFEELYLPDREILPMMLKQKRNDKFDGLSSPGREILPLLLEHKQFDEFEKRLTKRNNPDDFIHIYPIPYNGTLLDIACRSVGNSRIIRFLLKNCPNPNCVNEVTGKAPIHEVVESGDVDMLDEITKHDYVHFANAVDSKGYTPLHIAALKNHAESIRALINFGRRYRTPIDINIITREHLSPLHLALKEGNMQAASELLQRRNIDLDFQRDADGFTCRQIVFQKYPYLKDKFSIEPLSHPGPILHSLLARGLTESFIKIASEVHMRYLIGGYNDCSYLHLACHNGHTDVVEFLLNKCIDPNVMCSNNWLPIMIAARKGCYDIFEKLFHHPKIELQVQGHGSVLHHIIKGILYNYHVGERYDHYKCLELALNNISSSSQPKWNYRKPKLDIDFRDDAGSTALHLAVFSSDQQVQRSLIFAGAHLYQKDPSGNVPLDLIKAEVLSDYLDNCITAGDESKLETERKINFEYKQFVDPSKNNVCKKNEMEFFTLIERLPDHRKFLKHPVAESFIYIKWNFVKKYYYANLLFYLLFCVCLSTYILLKLDCGPSPFDALGTWCILMILCRTLTQLFYVLLILKEICQLLILSKPKSYFSSVENWLIIILIAIVGAVFIHDAMSTSLPPVYAASAILASLTELMFLIGKHPHFATNIEIFKTVAWNFSTFLCLYSTMILSFALSFYILFHEGNNNDHAGFVKNYTIGKAEMNKDDASKFWQSIPLSLFKTIIMLTGEFSADSSIPFRSNFSIEHIFFTVFVFCISMVLYNLLNGLAVSDTQAIRENAEIVGLASQVRLITQIEQLVESKSLNSFRRCLLNCFPCVRNVLEIQFYRGICSKTHASIRLHANNMMYIKPYHQFKYIRNEAEIPEKQLLKMRKSIVKRAQKVLENRSEVGKLAKCVQHVQIHNMKRPPLNVQPVNASEQYFTTHWHDVESKICEMIDKRDETLLQNVRTSISNSESGIYERMEMLQEPVTANSESGIYERMEMLQEPVTAKLVQLENTVRCCLLEVEKFSKKFCKNLEVLQSKN